jgi:hypothetical protein
VASLVYMLAIAVAASVGRRRRGWPYGRCLRRTAAAPAGGWARPALHTRNLAYRRGPPGRSQPPASDRTGAGGPPAFPRRYCRGRGRHPRGQPWCQPGRPAARHMGMAQAGRMMRPLRWLLSSACWVLVYAAAAAGRILADAGGHRPPRRVIAHAEHRGRYYTGRPPAESTCTCPACPPRTSPSSAVSRRSNEQTSGRRRSTLPHRDRPRH